MHLVWANSDKGQRKVEPVQCVKLHIGNGLEPFTSECKHEKISKMTKRSCVRSGRVKRSGMVVMTKWREWNWAGSVAIPGGGEGAAVGGGELANYCDVAGHHTRQRSLHSEHYRNCTWRCTASFVWIAALCVPHHWTALLAWPPYQRLQNGPDTHSSLRHHCTVCTLLLLHFPLHSTYSWGFCLQMCTECVRWAAAACWKKRLQVCTESCVCPGQAPSLPLPPTN